MSEDFVTIPITVHNAREAKLQDAIQNEFDEQYILYSDNLPMQSIALTRIINEAKELGLEASFITQLEKDLNA